MTRTKALADVHRRLAENAGPRKIVQKVRSSGAQKAS